MKLFTTSSGFIFAFGFDPIKRLPNPRMIHWCDPETGSWEVSASNQAGSMQMSFAIDPEFVREISTGRIVAYQSGKCLEIEYIGPPDVWRIWTLHADQSVGVVAA